MKVSSRILPTRIVLVPLAAFLGLVLLSACVSTPDAPDTSMADARGAIVDAEKNDARQYAGGELDVARGKLAMAERSIEQEDMVEAERLAREAEVMASLASAKTEAAKAVEINQQMERDAKALTEEMDRMGEQQ